MQSNKVDEAAVHHVEAAGFEDHLVENVDLVPLAVRSMYEPRTRRDVVTIPTIWVAIALSLLIHVAIMWAWLPRMHLLSPDNSRRGEANGSLVVQLAPRPSPPPSSRPAVPPSPRLQTQPSPSPRAQPSPTRRALPPKTATRPPPTPPAMALNQSAPALPAPSPATPSVAAPTPARPPADGDLASYIEAKRRARAESASAAPAGSVSNARPVENDNGRTDRIVAANLGSDRAATFGSNPTTSGGVFQIQRMGYDHAEFVFFGWNKDIRRNTNQLIEVRKGNNSDIRIAVVRKMIAIIREYEPEEFQWRSQRLGRDLTLSSRARDNVGLEDFMLREFFADPRLP